MKIRTGFVSNSSSSSFLIKKENLTALQIGAIIDHRSTCKLFNMYCDHYDTWNIQESPKLIGGTTDMDNFDMAYFLRELGIKEEHIEWCDWHELHDAPCGEDQFTCSDCKGEFKASNPTFCPYCGRNLI